MLDTARHPPLIGTASGRYLNFLNPDPADIDIRDIARGLSHESRFAGQTPVFYSVAAHSLLCVDLAAERGVQPRDALRALLLHDATEAYLKDIPSPLKAHLPEYRAIEAKLQMAIWRRFGCGAYVRSTLLRRAVECFDAAAFTVEKSVLFPSEPRWAGELDEYRGYRGAAKLRLLSPGRVEAMFLEAAAGLDVEGAA